MVGEFPELQGLMGGYYARAEGLPDAVADAIRDHYKPVGQGDDVPTAPVTVAVSLADKLDTLVSFFAIDEKPTGSKDPFALRRAALASILLILNNCLRFDLALAVDWALQTIFDQIDGPQPELAGLVSRMEEFRSLAEQGLIGGELAKRLIQELPEEIAEQEDRRALNSMVIESEVTRFFADRLKVQQREAGVRHDLIDAVFALGGEDDLVRLLARVHALQSFMETEDGRNLLAGYKRAANILKKEGYENAPSSSEEGVGGGEPPRATSPHPPTPSPEGEGESDDDAPHTGEEDPLALVDDPDMKEVVAAEMAERRKKALSYTPEPAEKALIDALDTAGPKASAAIEAEDFAGAMAALASLRAPIDAFFDSVTVNDEEAAKRSARLALLAHFRDAVHNVADFSKIEG